MNINQRLGLSHHNAKPVAVTATVVTTPVKSIALVAFKYLRLASERSHKLPSLIKQVSTEISDAWRETGNQSHPKS